MTLLLCAGIAALTVAMSSTDSATDDRKQRPQDQSSANAQRAHKKLLDDHVTTTFPVTIRQPSGPPTIDTDLIDHNGKVITVACSTCHTTRPPNRQNKTPKDLDEFHAGMPFSHGNVSCLSCHNDGDYDALKLADGSRVEFTAVMILCAQCHGQQMTAYEHGAHGGMSGHWDLTRGPRVKNNCVDCHNPHTPQFPKMQPTFKPKDRFLQESEH
ncbi:MAG: hypothetical protein HON04_10760 [Planctomicrobium sp.]|nr:hypothetical protein [Planctomicrobium sp.]